MVEGDDRGGRAVARRVLGIAALLATAWAGYDARALTTLTGPLRLQASPRGMVSLQLAPTAEDAAAIRGAWACRDLPPGTAGCADVTPVAQQALARHARLTLAWVLALGLTILWASAVARPSTTFVGLLLGLVLIGGLCDLAASWSLGVPLGVADRLPFDRVASIVPPWRAAAQDPAPQGQFGQAVTLARVASMTRFVLQLLGAVGTLALAGAALRLILLARRGQRAADVLPPPAAARLSGGDDLAAFRELLGRENAGIFPTPQTRSPDVPVLADNRAADEPRVIFRAADTIGLALSGGGIRSATFNLGLLEGLHRLNLLALFDYVSTVSGGGYVGSFWSEWLARQEASLHPPGPGGGRPEDGPPVQVPPARLFPSHRDAGSGPQDRVDLPQERHLREFSGFLAPRWGFFEVETWTAIVALVAGLLPALAIALSILGVLLVGWLSLTFPLAYPSRAAALPPILAITGLTLYGFERMWHGLKRASAGHAGTPAAAAPPPVRRGASRYLLVALAATTLVGALQFSLPSVYAGLTTDPYPVLTAAGWGKAAGRGAFERWWSVAAIANPSGTWIFSPRLFDYALAWLAASLALFGARVGYALWPYIAARESLAAYDRVLMRVLGLSVVWSGIAVLWHLAANLGSLGSTLGAAVVSGSIFAALRNWIGVVATRATPPGVVSRLKPYIPQALAYLTIVLAAVTVGQLLILACGTDWLRWWWAAAGMLGLMLLGLFIDPSAYGLHAFYRERITRAYAGACNIAEGQHAGENRGTEPRAGDDRPIGTLVARPLQLVCCAANDLSGDPVETLARGARSAVLSKHGFAIGRYWAPPGDLRLGSAVTASAAAFNSNMGRISMKVGPAVAFLMTALNLRLGLWLRHPAAAEASPRRWPGLLLYREMMGLTSASGAVPAQAVPALMRDIHLSDGGHFENLALYELVRRHCRYILMSDCGADPSVAFDDLGNALRRVREDFGVDISLDVEPLRPGPDRRSRQHVAVGTIHYSPTDRGIVIYVKPAITGDEPPDVLQYKTRNTAFPHESTGDQFYDEAQWESYRRLGMHTAEAVFAFVPPSGEPASGAGATSRQGRATTRPPTADWVFAEASHAWGGTPEGLVDRILEMTRRFADVEAELQRRAGPGLFAEVFPELAFVPRSAERHAGGAPAAPAAADPDAAAVAELTAILRVTQVMEDVWMACELSRWWSHPLNLGWINLFARWATAPTFRFWWPIAAPMFSPGFRAFLEERFPAPLSREVPGDGDPHAARSAQRARVTRLDPAAPDGLAARWWKQRSPQPRRWEGKALFQNELLLPRVGEAPLPMQVGIAAVTTHDDRAGWTSDDFFVPPSLWGAGIGWYFLDELLNVLARDYACCHVVVKAPPVDAQHQVALDDRRAFIEQYRKIGFREQLADGTPGEEPLDAALVDALGLERGVDTLLTLDFGRWSRRRGR